MSKARIVLVLAIVSLAALFYVFEFGNYLSLDYLRDSQEAFASFYAENTAVTLLGFFAIYVAVAAASLPGAAILTLGAGALFGLVVGTLVASFASSIGATLAFLISRFVIGDSIQAKFGERLKAINQGIEREGAFYLFALRLVPLFPFFLVNLVMGVTKIRVVTFYFVSQVGMLLGTIAFVNAGTQISEVTSLSGLLSFELLASFAALGVVPIVAKKIVNSVRARRVYKGYSKPKKFDRNMVVIGGGAAGLVSSLIAATVRAKVTLIERDKMGGDCLNTGCVPSKALIRSAKLAHQIRNGDQYGLTAVDAEFEFSKVMERVHAVIAKIEPHDSVERFTDLGVECLQGEAKIISPWEVEINGQVLTTKSIVIATGARPFVPPIPGLKESGFLTSDSLWEITELPKRLVILGGGPIGCELTQAFNRLGSQVAQVEMQDRLMSREDRDVSEYIASKFTGEGVDLHLETKALRVEGKTLICEKDGAEISIEFDQILVAVGRQARLEGFGLDELGIEYDRTLVLNDFLETNFPNIYACGDVAGPYQFTHTASHQAWFASVNALFGGLKRFRADYRVVPWATFTDPEVARVGINEQEAEEQGVEVQVTTYGIDDLDRAIADGSDYGWVKVLTVPGKDKILGATIVGEHAGDLLAEFTLAMKHGLGLNKIMGTIHIYPTLVESNKFAAGEWKKSTKPERLLNWVEKYHNWQRGE
ncbi:MAG: pyruvate/2-oxoglutarate dehydrogenase complex dihydrolipoamide dehydrogenase (E3) component [Gammaproteobacteria bacterium]|jgi:pyruvate/2-oxoglutarate dehydrogenase complex dihydrolipoamide dehydrogenase (E3) component/uncharacterized membrane protein YdjX (TVP38/TMEM64 family)